MLLFDLDGTLIDSNGVWVEVDRTFLARRGLEATPEYAHTVGHSIFPVAAQFTRDYYGLPDSAQDIMDEWLSLAGDAYSTHVPLKPGARAFLLRCQAAGEPMVLATACVPQLCRAALERHDLTEWFSAVFSAQELGLEKRDPATSRPCWSGWTSPPGRVPSSRTPPGPAAPPGRRASGLWACTTPFTPNLRGSCGKSVTAISTALKSCSDCFTPWSCAGRRP